MTQQPSSPACPFATRSIYVDLAHKKAPLSYFYYSECKRLVPNWNDY